MLKDITLGQFSRATRSPISSTRAQSSSSRCFYVVALFTAKSYIAYGVLILTLIVAVRISRVGAKALSRD